MMPRDDCRFGNVCGNMNRSLSFCGACGKVVGAYFLFSSVFAILITFDLDQRTHAAACSG